MVLDGPRACKGLQNGADGRDDRKDADGRKGVDDRKDADGRKDTDGRKGRNGRKRRCEPDTEGPSSDLHKQTSAI